MRKNGSLAYQANFMRHLYRHLRRKKNIARVIIYKTLFTTVVRTNNLQALTLMTNNWSTLKMSHDTVSDSAAQEHTVTIEMKGTREGFCVKTERINPGKDLLNLDLSKKKNRSRKCSKTANV
jgi:isochorismate hydrolase